VPDKLVAAIAERVTQFVLEPPHDDDPVIDWGSPDDLVDRFAASVGLAVEPGAASHDVAEILDAVEQVIATSARTSHPRFVNQNFAGADPVSVMGDWLGAALNTTMATFEVAPVFTLMEAAVLHRLAGFAGYPTAGDPVPALAPGVFVPGGSTGMLYALQLARHRHDPDIIRRGAPATPMAVFVSASGHYSTRKSAALLGIGTDHVIEVAADRAGAIDPDALEAAVAAAAAEGITPLAVVATAGTTVTCAFDDLHAVADVCERHDMWMHVDACYGGGALFSEAQAHRLAGVERSDSLVWNFHKMLGMTQQCSALLVKRPEQLGECFSGGADYLFQPDKLFADRDSGDRTFQCGRRPDALKLWLAWKAYGDDGFAARIDHAVAMGDHARRSLADRSDAFATVLAGDFTNVIFAWVPPHLRPLTTTEPDHLTGDVRDELHRLAPIIKGRMQAEGSGLIGFQPVHGMNTFRMICMNSTLRATDIDALLDHIDRIGTEVTAGR